MSRKEEVDDECGGNDTIASSCCPICLDAMSAADALHPIPHPPPGPSSSSCRYNFCLSCLGALYASSRDDYEMASDGNRHVKVKLACPNCRSHLSIDAVERTVRLRRRALAAELQHVPDGELSAGQLRCKHQLSSSTATAAAAATAEEDGIDGGKKAAVMEIDTTLFGGLDVAMSEQEQQFVTSLMTSGRSHDLCQAATILCGIANLLRDGKLKVVSNNNNHHTTTPSSSSSSSTTTTTTHSRSAVLSHGYSNAGMRTNRSYSNETEMQKSKRISNYQREAEERARDRLRRPLPARMPLCVALRAGEFEKLSLLRQQRQEEEIKSNRQIQQQHAQLAMMADQNHRPPPPPPTNESLPLGSRWGKWLKTGAKTLVANVTGYEGGGHDNGVNMTFVDDEWDGSIADAFARARVVSVAAARGNKGREGGVVGNEGEKGGGGGGATTTTTSNTATKMMMVKGRIGPRTEIEKEGVNRILAESSRIAANDGRPPFRTKRVLVASVRGQAGKCGIMKGDVITHVNGEPFTGTANDLRATLIHAYEEQGNDGIVMLVVNAEECTAEALRLRSRVR